MSQLTRRRDAVREALLAQNGAPDVAALAQTWGVSAGTIERDVEVVRSQPETTLAFFEAQRNRASARAWDLGVEMPESSRVAWGRLALDAEVKRAAMLGLKAPPAEEDGPPEVVMRIESPPGQPVVRPPVPARYRAGG